MRYFVDFYENVDVELIESYGGIIKYNYINIPSLCSIDIDDENIELLKTESIVKYVEKVGSMSGQGLRGWGWGYNAVNTDFYYSSGYTGKNVKVCILDTGLAYHSDLPTATLWEDFVNGSSTQYDDHEHGTFIAGIIAGQVYLGNSPDVRLYIGKVLDDKNLGYADDFVAGIDWAISQNVHIINFSITMHDDNETTVVEACRRAYNAGIIVVGISGNGVQNNFVARAKVNVPANDYSVIAVGGVNESLNRAYFSNYGSGLDLVAPAENITSTSSKYPYGNWQGTSFAAPFVVSHLACLKEKHPSYSRSQLVNKLYEDVQPLGNSWELGRGLLKASQVIPPVPSSPLFDTSYGNNNDGRFEGAVMLKWGSSSGATKYKVKSRRGYDGYIQEFSYGSTTTSGLVNGLQYGVTYYFSVCAGNSSGYSAYSSENFGTTAPKTPTINLGSVTSNSITINTGSMSGNYDKIRVYRQDNSAYLECNANSSVTFTGLTTGQSYSFYAKSRFIINNTTIWSANQSDTITANPSNPRPPKFYWDTPKVSGQPFDVKATEWNRLIQNVKDVHVYKRGYYDSSSYPITTVSKGQNFYAQRFNEIRFAIGSLNSTGIGTKYKNDTIYASELNLLVNKLNGIT